MAERSAPWPVPRADTKRAAGRRDAGPRPPAVPSPGCRACVTRAWPCLTLARSRDYPRPSFAPAKHARVRDEVLPYADPRVALPVGERQYHIGLGPGELAEYILLPGDPDRTSRIAARLDTVELEHRHREFATVTGTYRGQRVSVVSTGIGTDNVEITVADILALVGQPTFVRIGSCGGVEARVGVGGPLLFAGAGRVGAATARVVRHGL